jgi:hypothetical protein
MMAFLLFLRHKKNNKRNVRIPCLHLFDNITFVDGTSDFGKIVALHFKKNGKHEVMDNPPRWFKEQFEKAFGELLFV